MEKDVREIINDIRNITQRFELIRKSFYFNGNINYKMFDGPFGNSNKENFEKNINDASIVIAVLESKLEDAEKIIGWERKFQQSKAFRKPNNL